MIHATTDSDTVERAEYSESTGCERLDAAEALLPSLPEQTRPLAEGMIAQGKGESARAARAFERALALSRKTSTTSSVVAYLNSKSSKMPYDMFRLRKGLVQSSRRCPYSKPSTRRTW